MGKAKRGIYAMDRNVGSPCETWLVAGHDLSALHPKRTYSGTTRSSRLRTGHDTPMGKSLVYCFLVSQSRYAQKLQPGVSVLRKECLAVLLYDLFVFACLLAVLDPRVGHTIDELSPFISVLCHSD